MKIAILGTGGVGGFFGGKLAHAGNDVFFLARGDHFHALRSKGLEVMSVDGDFRVPNVKVYDRIEKMPVTDLVLLGVKSWQVKEMAKGLSPIMNEASVVIPLQNGVMAASELCDYLPKRQVLNGLCRIFSKVEAPGVIRHMGARGTIIFGEMDNQPSERTKRISQCFTEAAIDHFVPENIQLELWKKFISICLSGLMAVTHTSYGSMLAEPETREMMYAVLREVSQLARLKGIPVPEDYSDQVVAVLETYAFDATASLTRDVWAGRPSEIDYQNGTVVKMAQELGLDVPVNHYIYQTIRSKELKGN